MYSLTGICSDPYLCHLLKCFQKGVFVSEHQQVKMGTRMSDCKRGRRRSSNLGMSRDLRGLWSDSRCCLGNQVISVTRRVNQSPKSFHKSISCFIRCRGWRRTSDHQTLMRLKCLCVSLSGHRAPRGQTEILEVRSRATVVGGNPLITDVGEVASWIKSHE